MMALDDRPSVDIFRFSSIFPRFLGGDEEVAKAEVDFFGSMGKERELGISVEPDIFLTRMT